MKFKNKGLLLASLVSMGLFSCADESPWSGSDSEGGINLNLSSDSRVMRQTRADDSVSPVVPESNQFAVSLSKSDGTYSKDWNSVEAFNHEKAFPIGDYTLSASYGDIDQEGFNSPYYKGTASVHVSPGVVTDAGVVATLANAMVSIRYTDDFKSNFIAYSAAVQSEGHDWQVFAQDEPRPVYIAPSEVKLDLTLTNEAGDRVTIQPAGFTAVARHHYVVTIGVTGNAASGNLALDVVFDDDVVNETVNVSLGEELFSAPAPTVTAKGFSTDQKVETFEFAERKEKTEFHIFSFGGLKEAYINIEGYSPAFGNRVQLVGADALVQQQLIAEGIDCAGFFKNPDKMGVVNVNKFLEKLPAGNYSVQVYAIDAMTRQSDPISLSATVKPVTMDLSFNQSVEFLADEIAVQVTSNCPDVKDNVSFKVTDANGRMVDATVKSSSAASAPATRNDSYVFNYVLLIEPQIRSEINVVASLGNKTSEVKVPVEAPEYTITPDAFSRKVVLKIEAENADITKALIDNMKFVNGSSEIPTSNISVSNGGFITISGLVPATVYSDIVAKIGSFSKPVPEFTTESETNVPNGDFSLGTEKRYDHIQIGGGFTGTALSRPVYYHYANIVFKEPQGWATVNSNTCYDGSNPKNTWFMVPSTYINDISAAELRSVGYNHNGTVPGDTKKTAVYYCQNTPSDFKRAAGELFLGSYSFDASGESRVDGISFNSRPASLSFQYKYATVSESASEKGVLYVKLIATDGSTLFETTKELSSVSSMTDVTIPFAQYPFGVKASKLVLGFKSSDAQTPGIHVPSGTSLNDRGGLNNNNLGDNNYKSLAVGSVLTVNNVKLNYETSGPSAKPARRARR